MSNIVKTYFEAFNAGDVEAMLECLTADVAHHVNEGRIRVGKTKFGEFCEHMNHCYKEELTDMVEQAEFWWECIMPLRFGYGTRLHDP